MSTRRKFIKNSGLIVGGLPFIKYADKLPVFQSVTKPEIEIYNTNWGYKESLLQFVKDSKAEGYDGIEVWVPQKEKSRKELVAICADHQMKLGLLAGNSGDTVKENLESFIKAVDFAISCAPQFINCHSGKDFFTKEENKGFIEHTISKSNTAGLPIYHETHRGRILYAAPTAEHFIDKYEELKLTLDISHWTVVHESLLANQKERVYKALDRTGHIHSRVGFQEAPQIPNPNDPKYKNAVEAHFAWWDYIVEEKAKKGEKLTMTTEFGPAPYMWTHPFKEDPLENVWDINIAMKDLWYQRYLSK